MLHVFDRLHNIAHRLIQQKNVFNIHNEYCLQFCTNDGMSGYFPRSAPVLVNWICVVIYHVLQYLRTFLIVWSPVRCRAMLQTMCNVLIYHKTRCNVTYHITYGPGVSEHSAGNRINALVQYRFMLPSFALITLLQTGNKWRHLWCYYKQCHIFVDIFRAEAVLKSVLKALKCVMW